MSADPREITLPMMRESLYSAVICDALDSMGLTHQSPRVQLRPMTGSEKLVGRCRTTPRSVTSATRCSRGDSGNAPATNSSSSAAVTTGSMPGR